MDEKGPESPRIASDTQVVDLQAALDEANATNAELEAIVAGQRERIDHLEMQVGRLERANTELRGTISRLQFNAHWAKLRPR